jgi:hypothetical protein
MTVHDLLPTTETPPAEGKSRIHWLGWAAYLGMSWTWCIGMFLPVLLVRDYGFWGWVVFAIPNVVGAAAMGAVMNSRDRSQRVIDQHRLACVAFSLVTIVFHVFFASWFIYGVIGRWAVPLLVAVSLIAWLIGKGSLRRDVLLGVIALIISTAIFVTLVVAERLDPQHTRLNMDDGYTTIPLAFVCIFGFALCPYLDLTFHRARLETNNEQAKSAFQIGFGVFFFAMIVFTLWYARFFEGVSRFPRFAIPMIGLLVTHVLMQSGYTCALHVREVCKTINRQLATVFLLLALASVIFFGMLRIEVIPFYNGKIGEITYRYFMAFYGLAFPAYVWLCMIPYRRKPLIPPLVVFAVATLAAAPFYRFAFIKNEMSYIFVGLPIVLLARLLLYIPAPEARAASAQS